MRHFGGQKSNYGNNLNNPNCNIMPFGYTLEKCIAVLSPLDHQDFEQLPMNNNYLRLINTHTQGLRYDVTPLFADYQAFSVLIENILACFDSAEFHCVAGIDALGFILGTAIALRAEKGFIPIRKGGKLPVKSESVDFVDYTGLRKTLELSTNAHMPNTRVLIVDEWVETGAQMQAAIQLVEGQGGIIAGIAAINIDDNDVTRSMRKKYKSCSLWRGDSDSY